MTANGIAKIAAGPLVGTALLLMAASPPREPPAAATTPAPPEIDEDAMAALDRLGVYLRTLKAFQVKSSTTTDEVLEDGQVVEHDGVVDLLVRRPDRLRAEVSSDRQQRMFFYDGKTFPVWATRPDYYATVAAPATIADLADKLVERYDIELPLVDLFYWGTEKAQTREITSAIDLGPSQIDGVTCEQYAFRQPGLDWQIWIQQGDYPLPRKVILTTTTDEARPQYTTTMSWNLAPSFNDAAFAFVPGGQSKKIVLSEAERSDGFNPRSAP